MPSSLDTFRNLVERATEIRKEADRKLAADLGDRHPGIMVYPKTTEDRDDDEYLTILVALREFVAIHNAIEGREEK